MNKQYFKLYVQKVTSAYIALFCLVNNFTLVFFSSSLLVHFSSSSCLYECFFYICTVTYSGVFSVVKSELKIVLLFAYIW